MANDCHKLIIAYSVGGQFIENVLHFSNTVNNSTTPEADSMALISGFVDAVQPSMLGCMSADVTLLGYKAQRINNTGGPSAVNPVASGTTGGISGNVSNTRDAAVFTLDYYNAPATKPTWRVGRLFLGGVEATWMADNSWTNSALTAYLAFSGALSTPIGSSPGPWSTAIWSSTYNTFFFGGNWELTPSIGSLRRRIMPHL